MRTPFTSCQGNPQVPGATSRVRFRAARERPGEMGPHPILRDEPGPSGGRRRPSLGAERRLAIAHVDLHSLESPSTWTTGNAPAAGSPGCNLAVTSSPDCWPRHAVESCEGRSCLDVRPARRSGCDPHSGSAPSWKTLCVGDLTPEIGDTSQLSHSFAALMELDLWTSPRFCVQARRCWECRWMNLDSSRRARLVVSVVRGGQCPCWQCFPHWFS